MSQNSVFGGASRYQQYQDAQPEASEQPLDTVIFGSQGEDQDTASVPASAAAEDTSGTDEAPASMRPAETSAPEAAPSVPASEPAREQKTTPTPAPTQPEPQPAAEAGVRAVPLSGVLLTAQDAELAQHTQTRSAWKAFLAKFGLGTGPSKAELAERAAQQAADETVIRQQTWTRAMNIGVLNCKGGSGVTPGALITGGILADIRGGGVGILEMTSSPGSLAFRAEGRPRRGLSELLQQAPFIESAGNLAGFTAPQTSHAAVIGTVTERAQLTPGDISQVRAVVDTYYQLTVSDMDANLGSPMSLAAQRSMDGAIIPCTADNLSLARATETVMHLSRNAPHLFNHEGPNPVVIVVGHSGAPEDEEIAAAAVPVLRRETNGLVHVFECPYDPIFTSSAEIALADLLPATRATWTRAVATVVAHMQDTTPVTFTEGDHR